MKLPLAYYGNPILRKKAALVTEITDEIRQLTRDMLETMLAHNGIGIAAPQVHHSLALFLTKVPIQQADDKWTEGLLRIFINPKILSYSADQDYYSEGCLSIPKVYRDVLRPCSIVVEATDLQGNRFTEEMSGLEARTVMHENDHINGTLFIDRLPHKERKELEQVLREIKNKYNPKFGSL